MKLIGGAGEGEESGEEAGEKEITFLFPSFHISFKVPTVKYTHFKIQINST